jgi:hypothetical protein
MIYGTSLFFYYSHPTGKVCTPQSSRFLFTNNNCVGNERKPSSTISIRSPKNSGNGGQSELNVAQIPQSSLPLIKR